MNGDSPFDPRLLGSPHQEQPLLIILGTHQGYSVHLPIISYFSHISRNIMPCPLLFSFKLYVRSYILV